MTMFIMGNSPNPVPGTIAIHKIFEIKDRVAKDRFAYSELKTSGTFECELYEPGGHRYHICRDGVYVAYSWFMNHDICELCRWKYYMHKDNVLSEITQEQLDEYLDKNATRVLEHPSGEQD